MITKNAELIIQYHEATKHHPDRYAVSPGYMDWANQPNPFRFYLGSGLIQLPFLDDDPSSSHLDLYLRKQNRIHPFTFENISGMIELSLSLSAWKMMGDTKWSLRMNPSSGNLHPTESYWVIPSINSIPGGIYHYNALLHGFVNRTTFSELINIKWQEQSTPKGLMFALSSIFWRESWKYGERAFRYCLIDTGHALAAISFAANLMGWKVTCLNAESHKTIEKLLGFDQTPWIKGEKEEPEVLCWIGTNDSKNIPLTLTKKIVSLSSRAIFKGRPEALSKENHPWSIIDETAKACRKYNTPEKHVPFSYFSLKYKKGSEYYASQIIRNRRSAVAIDRLRSKMSREDFFRCIEATLPRQDHSPFDVGIFESSVHLFIFVHHVIGLESGFYVLVRNPDDHELLKRMTHKTFIWEQIKNETPLYLLRIGKFRRKAAQISCNQDIAGESAFSLGMVARFKEVIENEPYRYRELFWEAGMIGQVLYIESEAFGMRGTGIGCFFDNLMHDMCGFRDNTFQSLYHFTVGYPIEDKRLSTLPPYHHLEYMNGLK